MSGGAVVNMRGELVGLTTMAASPSGFDAMAGYAIPIDRIGRRAVETLKEGKEIEYGLLGISAILAQHQPGARRSRPTRRPRREIFRPMTRSSRSTRSRSSTSTR